MLDIHVGIRRIELKPFRRMLERQFGDHIQLSTMEDRWEDWGAHWPETQTDEDDLIHVMITTDVPMSLINYLVTSMLVFLNENTDEDNAFVNQMIVVSDQYNSLTGYGTFYHELSYPGN